MDSRQAEKKKKLTRNAQADWNRLFDINIQSMTTAGSTLSSQSVKTGHWKPWDEHEVGGTLTEEYNNKRVEIMETGEGIYLNNHTVQSQSQSAKIQTKPAEELNGNNHEFLPIECNSVICAPLIPAKMCQSQVKSLEHEEKYEKSSKTKTTSEMKNENQLSYNKNCLTLESNIPKCGNVLTRETELDSGIGNSKGLISRSVDSECNLDTMYDIGLMENLDLEEDAMESVDTDTFEGETHSNGENYKSLHTESSHEEAKGCGCNDAVNEVLLTSNEKVSTVFQSDDNTDVSRNVVIDSEDGRNGYKRDENSNESTDYVINIENIENSPVEDIKYEDNIIDDEHLAFLYEAECSVKSSSWKTCLPTNSLYTYTHKINIEDSKTNDTTYDKTGLTENNTCIVLEEKDSKNEFSEFKHSHEQHLNLKRQSDAEKDMDYMCEKTEDESVLCEIHTDRGKLMEENIYASSFTVQINKKESRCSSSHVDTHMITIVNSMKLKELLSLSGVPLDKESNTQETTHAEYGQRIFGTDIPSHEKKYETSKSDMPTGAKPLRGDATKKLTRHPLSHCKKMIDINIQSLSTKKTLNVDPRESIRVCQVTKSNVPATYAKTFQSQAIAVGHEVIDKYATNESFAELYHTEDTVEEFSKKPHKDTGREEQELDSGVGNNDDLKLHLNSSDCNLDTMSFSIMENLNQDLTESDVKNKHKEETKLNKGSKQVSDGGNSQDETVLCFVGNVENELREADGEEHPLDLAMYYCNINDTYIKYNIGSDDDRIIQQKDRLSNESDDNVTEEVYEQEETNSSDESEGHYVSKEYGKTKYLPLYITEATTKNDYNANDDINEYKINSNSSQTIDVTEDSISDNDMNEHHHHKDIQTIGENEVEMEINDCYTACPQESPESSHNEQNYDETIKSSDIPVNSISRTSGRLLTKSLTKNNLENPKALSRNPLTHWQKLVDININSMAKKQNVLLSSENLHEESQFNIRNFMKYEHEDDCSDSGLCDDALASGLQSFENDCMRLRMNDNTEEEEIRLGQGYLATSPHDDMSPHSEMTDGQGCEENMLLEKSEDKEGNKILSSDEGNDHFYQQNCFLHSAISCNKNVSIADKKEAHRNYQKQQEEEDCSLNESILDPDPDTEYFGDTDCEPVISNDTENCSETESFKSCSTYDENLELLYQDIITKTNSMGDTEEMASKGKGSDDKKFHLQESTTDLKFETTNHMPENPFPIDRMDTDSSFREEVISPPKDEGFMRENNTCEQDSNEDIYYVQNESCNTVGNSALPPPLGISSFDDYRKENLNTAPKLFSPGKTYFKLIQKGSDISINKDTSETLLLNKTQETPLDSEREHAVKGASSCHDIAVWNTRHNPFNTNDSDTDVDLDMGHVNERGWGSQKCDLHSLVKFYPSTNTITVSVEESEMNNSFEGCRQRNFYEGEEYYEGTVSTESRPLVYNKDCIDQNSSKGLMAKLSDFMNTIFKKPIDDKNGSEMQHLMELPDDENMNYLQPGSMSINKNLFKTEGNEKEITETENTIQCKQGKLEYTWENLSLSKEESDHCIHHKRDIKCSPARLDKCSRSHGIESHERIRDTEDSTSQRQMFQKRSIEAKGNSNITGNLLLDVVDSKWAQDGPSVCVLVVGNDVIDDYNPRNFGKAKTPLSEPILDEKCIKFCDKKLADKKENECVHTNTDDKSIGSPDMSKKHCDQEKNGISDKYEQKIHETGGPLYSISTSEPTTRSFGLETDDINKTCVSREITNIRQNMNDKKTTFASRFPNDLKSKSGTRLHKAGREETSSDNFSDSPHLCNNIIFSKQPDILNEEMAVNTSCAPNNSVLSDFFKKTASLEFSHQTPELPVVIPPQPLHLQTLLKPVQPRRRNILPVENIGMLVPRRKQSSDTISSSSVCSKDTKISSLSLDSFSEVGEKKTLVKELCNDGKTCLENEDLLQSSLECVLEMLSQRGKVEKAFVASPEGEILAKTRNLEICDAEIKCLTCALSSNYQGMVKMEIFGDFYICIKHEDDSYVVGRGKEELFVALRGEHSIVVGFSNLTSHGSCIKEVQELSRVLAQRGL